jgi:hypothetical protein
MVDNTDNASGRLSSALIWPAYESGAERSTIAVKRGMRSAVREPPAIIGGQPQQAAPAFGFAVSNRVHPGIEQRETGYTVRCQPHHLERNAPSHGMARHCESLRGQRQDVPRHGGNR